MNLCEYCGTNLQHNTHTLYACRAVLATQLREVREALAEHGDIAHRLLGGLAPRPMLGVDRILSERPR
jgi:hypothetical protein